MELEVRHLRAVCAIADAGSLHKAARALGVTQPSLTTQLRRIEHEVGGRLFVRRPDGCRPTELGRQLLSRARPLVREMSVLVTDMRAAATRTAEVPQLRIGATHSRALPGWLRRLRVRCPAVEVAVRTDLSANALLRMVVDGELDIAFVHEVEGTRLRVPEALRVRVLLDREPQCVALAASHPAAGREVVRLADLADQQWMVEQRADGEWEGAARMLRAAGLGPRLLHGDYLITLTLVAAGEVVALCAPTSPEWDGVAVRRIEGDPLGVRWMLAARSEARMDEVYDDLVAAYLEVAGKAPAYKSLGAVVFGK